MKTKALFWLLLFAMIINLSSCGLFLATKVDVELESDVKEVDFSDNSEDTFEFDSAALIERLPEDAGGLPLSYHVADDGNVIVACNGKNAWLFDLVLDKTFSLVNYDNMLEAADIAGRSGEYFAGDCNLSVEVHSPYDGVIDIYFTVKSDDGKAEYKVYSSYSCEDDADGRTHRRGELFGYYYQSMSFPGSEKGVTIEDFSDVGKLGISEDDGRVLFAKALVNNDVETLAALWSTDVEALSDFRNMVISDYSLTRFDFSPNVAELFLWIKIEKSNLEKLPAGTYTLKLREGMYFTDVEFLVPNEAAGKDLRTDGIDWIYGWASSVGWHDPAWRFLNPDEYVHAMLDFMLAKEGGDTSNLSGSGFAEFCDRCFDYMGVSVDDGYVTGHGGHGTTFTLCKFSKVISGPGTEIITVDYYVDGLYTVIAFTHEFTLLENEDGSYKLIKCVRTYDSGFKAFVGAV